jgi:hypothetical protein
MEKLDKYIQRESVKCTPKICIDAFVTSDQEGIDFTGDTTFSSPADVHTYFPTRTILIIANCFFITTNSKHPPL